MKTWVLLLSLLVLLAFVSILVGVATWHMAYEEASFQAAIGLQQSIDSGKRECRDYIRTLLKHQSEYIKDIKAGHQQRIRVNIGILGLDAFDTQVVKEAVKDIMKNNVSNFQFESNTARLPNRTVVEQAQELHELLNVQVFIGPDSEHELIEAVVWARNRPDPKEFVVFITSAFITTKAYLEMQANDQHAVIQMNKSYPNIWKAVFSQIKKQKVEHVLLIKPEDGAPSSHMQVLRNSSNGVEVIEVTSKKSMSPQQVVHNLENEMESILKEHPDARLGFLITENYMFTQLAAAPMYSQIFSIPWFTTIKDVLYDTHLLDNKFLKHEYFDLNYVTLERKSVKNFRLLADVVDRSKQSHVADVKVNTQTVELTYDSAIIASHVGSWLVGNKAIDVGEFGEQVSWESTLWAGISGILKISPKLDLDYGAFLDLHYTRSLSDQLIEYPSGVWQVRGYIVN